VPGSDYKPIASVVKPGKGGYAPLVRVKGALVYIPSLRGLAKAIVVKDVEIVKPGPIVPLPAPK
jgi:hypothetical protein